MSRKAAGVERLDYDQLLSSTMSDADPNELARVLKTVADPVRLKLVNVIARFVHAVDSIT